MEIRVEEGYPDAIDDIENLFLSLGGFSRKVFDHALMNRVLVISVMAYESNELIGCKVGFSPRPMYFESWVGGVKLAFQGKGLAKKFTQKQHDFCRGKGIKHIETIVAYDNVAMQIVNLKSGMKVIGTFLDVGNELKLKFQKEL